MEERTVGSMMQEATYSEALLIQSQIEGLKFPEGMSLAEEQTNRLEIKQLEAKLAALQNWRERHAIIGEGLRYSGDDYEYKAISVIRAIAILIEGWFKGYCSFPIFLSMRGWQHDPRSSKSPKSLQQTGTT